MCGIVGRFAWDAGLEPELVAGVVNHMSHRGPDEGAFWADERFAFGHRRLSIIDLSSGQQPMGTEEGDLVVTFNGEIYNTANYDASSSRRVTAFARAPTPKCFSMAIGPGERTSPAGSSACSPSPWPTAGVASCSWRATLSARSLLLRRHARRRVVRLGAAPARGAGHHRWAYRSRSAGRVPVPQLRARRRDHAGVGAAARPGQLAAVPGGEGDRRAYWSPRGRGGRCR